MLMVVQETIEEELQDLIRNLPTAGVDKCTMFFTKDALKRGNTPSTETVSEAKCNSTYFVRPLT